MNKSLVILPVIISVFLLPISSIACPNAEECANVSKSLSASDCLLSERKIFASLENGKAHFQQPLALTPERIIDIKAFGDFLKKAGDIAIRCSGLYRNDALFEHRMKVVGSYPAVESWINTLLKHQPNGVLLRDDFFQMKGREYFIKLLSAYQVLLDLQPSPKE